MTSARTAGRKPSSAADGAARWFLAACLAGLTCSSCRNPPTAQVVIALESTKPEVACQGAECPCTSACGPSEACIRGKCRPAAPLVATGARACTLVSKGVACWGAPAFGTQLATSPHLTLTTPAAALAISSSHACALSAKGRVSCWSDGPATELAAFDDAIGIALSRDTLCILREYGKLECGGLVPSPGTFLTPRSSPTNHDILATAGGPGRLCVVRSNGAVWCWNDEKSIPAGGMVSTGEREWLVQGIQGAQRLALGTEEACAIGGSGKVSCWPFMRDGRGTESFAAELPATQDTVALAVGAQHACRLTSAGTVQCWGSNGFGQLGTLSGGDFRPDREHVSKLHDATAVAAGDSFSCARRTDGSTWCWGSASRGRLGDGSSMEFLEPTNVPNLSGATSVFVGPQRSCALTDSDQLWCWGGPETMADDEQAELVLPSAARTSAARGVAIASAPSDVVCVLDDAGDLRCDHPSTKGKAIRLGAQKVLLDELWGENVALVSGKVVLWRLARDGTLSISRIPGMDQAIDIARGAEHVCAVLSSGRVSCLNPRKVGDRATRVDGIDDARSISGQGTFLVLRKTGEAILFKEDYREQDPNAPRFRTTPIAKLGPSVAARATRSHACAITSTSELYCWGANEDGSLGLGDQASRSEPARSKLTSVTSIALSERHGCAVSEGKVYCWGSNSNRQVSPVSSARFVPRPILAPQAASAAPVP